MKILPSLLSCLFMTAVVLPYSGAAWSGAPASLVTAKSSGKPVLKKTPAKKVRARLASAKSTGKAGTVVTATPPVAMAPAPETANPYLPESPGPVPTKPNPYLENAVVTAPSAGNAYLPAAAAATLVIPAADLPPVVATTPTDNPVPPSVTPVVAAPPAAAEISAPSKPAPAEAAPLPTTPALVVVTPQPVITVPPVVVAPARPVSTPQAFINPYLANTQAFYQTPATAAYSAPTLPNFSVLPNLPGLPDLSAMAGLSGLPGLPALSPDMDKLWYELRSFLPEPHMPTLDMDILPSITKVFPTGEKPMYVLTFKCPTELIGITPLPTKALRWLITSGMEAVNSTDLLPFNMQQVCQ